MLWRSLSQIGPKRPTSSPFTTEQLAEQFNISLAELGLGTFDLALYVVRHSGASADVLHKRRTPAEVKLRGRWLSDSSMERYVKATHVLALANKVPPRVMKYGGDVKRVLAKLFGGQLAIFSCPA